MAEQNTEFSLGYAFSEGWQVMKRHYGVLLGASAISLFGSAALSLIPVVGPVAQFLVAGPLLAGWLYLGVRSCRGEVRVGDLFLGFGRFPQTLGTYWLVVLVLLPTLIPAVIGIAVGVALGMDALGVAASIAGGLVSLVLYGLVAVRLAFSWQFCLDRQLGVVESVRRSWLVTRPHRGTLFALGLSLVLVVIGLSVLLMVPVVVLGMPFVIAVLGATYCRIAAADLAKPRKLKPLNPFVVWRRASQVFFLLALNPYVFMYRGLCVPAMNCWACPAAAYGCPIGAIGNFLAKGIIPFVAIGLMLLLGALAGRLICGWVCPFGLLQDLMNKIPSPKLKFPKPLAYAKYAFLVLTVFVIPLSVGIDRTESGVATSDFFFCNYCPAGTLEAAIPVKLGFSRFDGATAEPSMLAEAAAAEEGGGAAPGEDPAADEEDFGMDEEDAELGEDLFGDDSTGSPDLFAGEDDGAAGDPFALPEEGEVPEVLVSGGSSTLEWFFTSPRMWVLYAFLGMFVLFRRPFCRGVCPIGASFALLNRFSFFRMRVKKDQCKSCNACAKKCPVDNKVYFDPSSDDCIRCMECVTNCKRGGVEVGALPMKTRDDYWE